MIIGANTGSESEVLGGTPSPPSITRAARAILIRLGELLEKSVIDYACISAEVSNAGLPHLQGFVVFNESAFGTKQDPRKPSDYITAHWLKARNLSGSRDYCARAGIHIGKKGVFDRFEFGDWVDPGWNQTLRSRLIYEFAHRLKAGTTTGEIARSNPDGALLVGLNNLEGLLTTMTKSRDRYIPRLARRPYCYIGRTFLIERLESREFLEWGSHDEEE